MQELILNKCHREILKILLYIIWREIFSQIIIIIFYVLNFTLGDPYSNFECHDSN